MLAILIDAMSSIFVAFILEAFLMQLELVSGAAPDELYLQLQDLFLKSGVFANRYKPAFMVLLDNNKHLAMLAKRLK